RIAAPPARPAPPGPARPGGGTRGPGAGNPAALDCVRLLTRQLAVREEAGRLDRFTSGSFVEYPGLTLCTYPRAGEVDAGTLVDALVHETIHAALYLYEALHEPLLGDRRSADLPIRSPWSGRVLACSQFVQACFVWFGLMRLWGGWPEGAGGV